MDMYAKTKDQGYIVKAKKIKEKIKYLSYVSKN
jgi:hypothetical protein